MRPNNSSENLPFIFNSEALTITTKEFLVCLRIAVGIGGEAELVATFSTRPTAGTMPTRRRHLVHAWVQTVRVPRLKFIFKKKS